MSKPGLKLTRPNLTQINTTGVQLIRSSTSAPTYIPTTSVSLLNLNTQKEAVGQPKTNLPAPTTSALKYIPTTSTSLLNSSKQKEAVGQPKTSPPLPITSAPNILPATSTSLPPKANPPTVRQPKTNPPAPTPEIIDLTLPEIPATHTPVSVAPAFNQPAPSNPALRVLAQTPEKSPVMRPQNSKQPRRQSVKENVMALAKTQRLLPSPRIVKDVPLRSPVVAEAAKADEPSQSIENLLCENRVREFERSQDNLVKFWSIIWPWTEPRKMRIIYGFSNYKREYNEQYNLTAINTIMAFPEWWVHIEVYDIPEGWKKEDVMNGILDFMPELSFIPCFIDFGNHTLRFLVGKCNKAFWKLYDKQFSVSVNGQNLSLNVADFIKRGIQLLDVSEELSNQLDKVYDHNKKSLNLSHFLQAPDITYIMYFPLAHLSNQYTLVNIKTNIPWHNLSHLDLSNNNLKDIDNFGFNTKMPKLQTLNLSNNKLHNILHVACCKGMKVSHVWLEGNPLCYDYVNQVDYIEVVKTIFPNLCELDGVNLDWSGTPMVRDNYLIDLDAHSIVEKFLEVYFALIESNDKTSVHNLYTDDAMFSVTCGNLGKIEFRRYLMLFQNRSRDIRKLMDPTDFLYIGAKDIASLIGHWPHLQHDPLSFFVDVHFHSATATILTVSGILKIPSATFKDEEPVLEFTRTFVLKSFNNYEYKIINDMMHLTMATGARAEKAFEKILLTDVDHGLKFETAPSDEMKEKLIAILVKLIQLPKNEAQKCLEMRNWHLKHAIEYFIILQNRNELHILTHNI